MGNSRRTNSEKKKLCYASLMYIMCDLTMMSQSLKSLLYLKIKLRILNMRNSIQINVYNFLYIIENN